MSTEDAALSLDAWLEQVRRQPGLEGVGLALDRATERAILDLTRVAAHRSERIAGPMTAYLAGLAAARIPESERAEFIAALVSALDTDV